MKIDLKLYRDPDAAAAAAAAGAAGAAAVVEPPVADPAGAAAAADFKPASASASVDLNAAAAAKPAEGAFVLPDAYKDKPYLKGVDSQEKLLKMLDGAQELIGKKGPAIPKADATQAEKDAYYDSIGRPKTAAEYVLDGGDKSDPAFVSKVKDVFHKHGLSAEVAKGIWADVGGVLGGMKATGDAAAAQLDIDFNDLATKTFGTERETVLARGKELISANISPAMKTAIEKLDNNALIVLADVMRNVDKKYIRQDGAGGQTILSGGSADELRAKARGFMAEQNKYSPTSVEFTNLQRQIDGIYDNLRKSNVKLS